MSAMSQHLNHIDWTDWETRAYLYVLIYTVIFGSLFVTGDSQFRHMSLVVVACAIVSGACFTAFEYISPYIHPCYTDLPYIQKKNWNLRLLSCTHAIIVTVGGISAIVAGDLDNMATSYSVLGTIYIAIFAGYCAADSYLTLKYWDVDNGSYAIIIHHVLVLIISIYPIYTHAFTLIGVCYLVNEMSTPFMNLIQFFKDCKVPKDSPLVKLNSITFLVCFFVCRVLMNTYIMIRMLIFTEAFFQNSAFVYISGTIFMVTFWCLQVYWFVHIIRRAIKILSERPPERRLSFDYESISQFAKDLAEDVVTDEHMV